MEVLICVMALFHFSSAENIFCVESGMKTLSGDPCSQPILYGPTKYGYNTDTRTCQSFTPGCTTNGNNFESIQDCQRACVRGYVAETERPVSGTERPKSDHMIWRADDKDKLAGYTPTKWCGRGSSAKSYDDLGFSKEADSCCRAHDNCPDHILKGETNKKYNLTNDASYTRLSCECDEEFHRCLHKANTLVANQIGYVYFDGLATECFKKDYPIKGCKNTGGFLFRKCVEYELDTSAPKIYQWFSVPNYDDNDKNKLEWPVSVDALDKLSDYSPTKWCGRGSSAKSHDDLGFSKEADSCCRAHDNCPDYILKGETNKKYNLTNDASYTRLSCECDEQFRQCLHKANTAVANQIGNIYFNTLGTECYRQEYPIKKCKKRGMLNRKCLEYEFDTSAPKIYQWFSVPNYERRERKKLRKNVNSRLTSRRHKHG